MEELAVTEELRAEAPKGKNTSLKKDAALTSLAQLVVAFTSFFQYRIIRHYWVSVPDFAAYSQLFRVRIYAESLVLLVLTTALPAQIAAMRSNRDDRSEGVYTWTGLGLCLILMLVDTALARVFPQYAALALFGNRDMADWVGPFCNLLFGYGFASVMCSMLRGFMRYRLVNVLAICFGGITPLACPLLMRSYPLRDVVSASGFVAWGFGAIFLGIMIKAEFPRIRPAWGGLKRYWDAAKDLLSYGAPRTITVACTAIFTLMLPWFANNQQDVPLVGSLNAVLLILVGSTIFVSGLGFVLLPRFSMLFAKGHSLEARRQLGLLVEFTIFAGGIGSLSALGLLRPFLKLWIGGRIAFPPMLIGAACLAIPTVLILEILRSPIDAASRRPLNALTYGVGAAASIVIINVLLALHVPLPTVLSAALIGGYYLAATVSMLVAHKLYRFEISLSKLAIPLAFLGVSLAILLKEQVVLPAWMLFLACFGCCVLYIVISVLVKPAWVAEILPKRFRGRPKARTSLNRS